MGTTAWIASPVETVELLDELGVMIALRKERRERVDDGLKEEILARVDKLFAKHPMP